uniref:Tail protein n=1 Tax=uncultured marine virus TaxID=186617 RepID=A0A0F7L5R3_9VIRU|nr:tail protein [uncultured marine virus]
MEGYTASEVCYVSSGRCNINRSGIQQSPYGGPKEVKEFSGFRKHHRVLIDES